MKRATRRLIATLAVVAFAAGAAWTIASIWFPGRSFDAAAWRMREQNEDHVAAEMADRLIGRSLLRGKTREEVVQLLGEPDKTGYFQRYDMVYYLGPERGLFGMLIDSEWLVFRLGTDGRVAEYRIVRD